MRRETQCRGLRARLVFFGAFRLATPLFVSLYFISSALSSRNYICHASDYVKEKLYATHSDTHTHTHTHTHTRPKRQSCSFFVCHALTTFAPTGRRPQAAGVPVASLVASQFSSHHPSGVTTAHTLPVGNQGPLEDLPESDRDPGGKPEAHQVPILVHG